MKSLDVSILLLAFGFLAACAPQPKADIGSVCLTNNLIRSETEMSALQEIQRLGRSRTEYLGMDFSIKRKARIELRESWRAVMENRAASLQVLRKYRSLQSFDLYGCGADYGYIQVAKMPDDLHALLLICCIDSGMYFFNRDCSFGHSYSYSFRNEHLNFLYAVGDTSAFSRITMMGALPKEVKVADTQMIWPIVDSALSQGRSVVGALRQNGYAWYQLSKTFGPCPPLKPPLAGGSAQE